MSDTDVKTDEAEGAEEQAEKLQIDVKVETPSACQRHVTVTIPRDDINRYYDDAYSEMMPNAAVPGFRAGRAPRKLVEHRFHKEVTEQIKGSLLADSMAQVSDDESLVAISEPEFNFEAVELPDDGPMTFEFDLEVRPEFDLPKWKGLDIERPVRKYSDDDVREHLEKILSRYGKLTPHDGKVAAGDFVVCDVITSAGDEELASAEEQTLRVRPELRFRDGTLQKFDKLMTGATSGDTREGKLKLAPGASNEALRGKEVEVSLKVLDVKKLELPELTPSFLKEMGDFDSEGDLLDAIRDSLERQLEYEQQQQVRKQVTAALIESADWDLPPTLLKRQSIRELERAVLELRRAGYPEGEIRARENELRQNSAASTAKALKEHFILERIAEEEKVEADEADYQAEIVLIAHQSGESARRVRAQLEKRGMMDALRNQIVERKVLALVQEQAKFKDVPQKDQADDAEAIDMAAGGGEEPSIPEITEESPEAATAAE